MKKRIIILLMLIVLVTVTFAFTINSAYAEKTLSPEQCLEKAKVILNVEDKGENLIFEDDIKNKNLYQYKTKDNYYLIEKDTGRPRIFVKKELDSSKSTKNAISKFDAEKIVKDELARINKNFFNSEYRIITNVIELNNEYSIQINQINQNGFDDGDSAYFRLSGSGEILCYVLKYSPKMSIEKRKNIIDESKVVNIATDAASKYIDTLLNDTNKSKIQDNSLIETKPIPKDDPEKSDAELLGIEEKSEQTNLGEFKLSQDVKSIKPIVEKIKFKNKSTYAVKYRIFNNYNISFVIVVYIDAETGEVVSIDKTV